MTPAPRDVWHPDVRHVGRPVYLFDELDSTNARAQTLPPGSAVIADHQTAGRGQYGRTWTSRPGSSLLLSVVLDPPPDLRRAVVLTAWAATSIAESVRKLTALQTRIKWPNDLLLSEKKVCGILIEQGRTTVCGIGLNVNPSPGDFEADGLPGATSLAAAAVKSFEVREVAAVVLSELDDSYDRLLAGGLAGLEAEWSRRTGLSNRSVVAELADGTTASGQLRSLGFDGIELESGPGAVRVLVPEHVRQLRPG